MTLSRMKLTTRAVDDGDQDALELQPDLHRVALDQAGRAADGLDREDAGQQRADDAADAVHAEGVEAVVVAERCA